MGRVNGLVSWLEELESTLQGSRTIRRLVIFFQKIKGIQRVTAGIHEALQGPPSPGREVSGRPGKGPELNFETRVELI